MERFLLSAFNEILIKIPLRFSFFLHGGEMILLKISRKVNQDVILKWMGETCPLQSK